MIRSGRPSDMPTDTIRPITEDLIRACDALDGVISAFLSARQRVAGFSQYESTAEALNLFNLVIRHVEGVLVLAREDLVLLPAAYASARAALETSTKAAWMVDADDPFVREARWLAHLQEEERVYERAAKRTADDSRDSSGFAARAADLKQLRLGITDKLPTGVSPLKGNPSMEDMLASLDGQHLYALYIYLSQFVHGGHAATWLYRKGLGTHRSAGEFIGSSNWYIALRICWLSLSQPGSLLLSRLGASDGAFLTPELEAKVVSAIEATKEATKPPLH